MKKISVSFALARFVFLSSFTLAVISTVLVINYVVDYAEKEQTQLMQREAATISNNYQLFLHHRLLILTEHASYPVIRQTLMQPETNIGKVKDFMADLTVLGQRYQQSLLDFDGNILYSTQSVSTPDYKAKPWLASLLNNESKNYVGIETIKKKHYWCLVVPIYYNQLVEGVLATLIPIEEIDQQNNVKKHINGLMIEIIKEDVILTTFGDISSGRQHQVHWQKLPLTFRFTFDDSASTQELQNVIVTLSLLIMLVLLLTTSFAYFFGYRYFVKPLLLLSKATGELDKSSDIKRLQENIGIKELSELFHKFNAMTEKVFHREQALQRSYDKLSTANEELIVSQSQLIQSEKMASIGVLAAGVAHEINNPIGFINSNLNVLLEYITAIEHYYHAINQRCLVTKEAQSLQRSLAEEYDIEYIFKDITPLLSSSIGGIEKVTDIVKNLKTFARVEQPIKTKTDINEGLSVTLNMVKNELKYNCDVQVTLGELPFIDAFPSKLNQVFINLLINAGQSIKTRGFIYVRTFQKNNEIVIEIEDTGSGIASDILAHIFTPFFTSKPVGQGTGLGLSISHEIIKQHGGRITVRSKVGQGSCFSVFIPIN